MRHGFKRTLQKAGLRQIRIHDLRHTFASLLLQHGESVVYVKEQLGHASIQITVDNVRPLDSGREPRCVDRLDDAWTQPDATQAQPQPDQSSETLAELQELLGNLVTLTFASWNQTFVSWNQIAIWLRRLEALRQELRRCQHVWVTQS